MKLIFLLFSLNMSNASAYSRYFPKYGTVILLTFFRREQT